MGKLHSIRKEIERDPSRWYVPLLAVNIRGGNKNKAYGARFYRGKWIPWELHPRASYRAFVRSVLAGLGIADIG